MSKRRIGQRDIRSLLPGETIWDSGVTGFGARRQKGSTVSYILLYRTAEGRQRWHTIGRHGAPWTPDTARAEALKLLGQVAGGLDPTAEKRSKRRATTVSELCDLYLADAESGRLLTRRQQKKLSTLITDRGRIRHHIKPILGRMSVNSVTQDDIEDFMHAVAAGRTATKVKTKLRGLANVRGGKGTASRTVGLLGAIFSYAVKHRMCSFNPVRGIVRFADGQRNRRFDDSEYATLGKALSKAQQSNVPHSAIAVARFLAATGWRTGEALGLRWSEIDLGRRTARLQDTKTGYSVRPLSRASCELLNTLPRSNELVFPATRGEGRLAGFPKLWARIAKLGNLPKDLTPHVLRHSFCSLAGDLGLSEPTIAALVGHKSRTITSRYIHAADDVLLAASDVVANKTIALMNEDDATAAVIPFRALG